MHKNVWHIWCIFSLSVNSGYGCVESPIEWNFSKPNSSMFPVILSVSLCVLRSLCDICHLKWMTENFQKKNMANKIFIINSSRFTFLAVTLSLCLDYVTSHSVFLLLLLVHFGFLSPLFFAHIKSGRRREQYIYVEKCFSGWKKKKKKNGCKWK